MILRGAQNIFPREIEDVLSQHPRVRDIAIVGMPDRVLGERVCAFVVAKEGQGPTVEEFADFLANRNIAKFKWPERVETLEALPLGPGGKVLKTTLRQIISDKLAGEAPSGPA
jgi:non-ribosomal peptide synthetase component E (peptide arylation enzyme)